MNKPKLIILSGSLGSGKSTLAQKYVEDHPLALNLDIDDIRAHLGQWREQAEESANKARALAETMVKVHLRNGYDVIIPQIYRRESDVLALEAIAKETEAKFYEIVLWLGKEEAVKRAIDRGIHPGGLIEQGGGVKKLESMYDEMAELISKRPGTIKVEPKLGEAEGTYRELLGHISS